MNSEKKIDLSEIRLALAVLAKETRNEYPDLYFDYAGLIPEQDENTKYDSSPTNTKVFARTGGDGVHYSILELSENIQPVVMTVPMNCEDSMEDCNIILGENLKEFLSIGYYNGWFPIEQLCYDNNWVIDFYSKENKEEDYQKDGDAKFVKKLRDRFNYNHVPLNNERLKELSTKYFKELKFNQEFIDEYIEGQE